MFPRRDFLSAGAAAAITSLAASTASRAADDKSSDKVRVGVMGLKRGESLALGLAKTSGVEVATLCDVDTKRLADFSKKFEEETKQKPQTVTDFRRILDDKNIDALICAAPNHCMLRLRSSPAKPVNMCTWKNHAATILRRRVDDRGSGKVQTLCADGYATP